MSGSSDSEGAAKVAVLLLHGLVNQRRQPGGEACPQAAAEEKMKPGDGGSSRIPHLCQFIDGVSLVLKHSSITYEFYRKMSVADNRSLKLIRPRHGQVHSSALYTDIFTRLFFSTLG